MVTSVGLGAGTASFVTAFSNLECASSSACSSAASFPGSTLCGGRRRGLLQQRRDRDRHGGWMWQHGGDGAPRRAQPGAGASAGGRQRGPQKPNAEAGGPGGGGPGDANVRATLEQGKRLLAMQRELLEQVEERKKLYSAIVHGFDSSKELGGQGDGADDGQADGAGKNAGSSTRGSTTAWPSSPPSRLQPSSPTLKRQTSTPPRPVVSPLQPVQSPLQSIASPARPKQPYTAPLSSPATRDLFDQRQNAVPVAEKETDAALPELTTGEVGVVQDDKPPPLAGPNVMNVVMVAAECAPWSKTGGLGDVVGALPKALARRGHRVMVVAPRYSNYAEAWETGVRKVYNVAGQDMEVGYFHGYIDGVDYVFVDNHVFHAWAGNIYGGGREEVLFRMILLCKAAVEAPWHVPCGGVPYGDGNLVFIANDWHTALLPVYLQAYYRDVGLMQFTRSVLVIHNMAHQGRGPFVEFGMLGLPPHYADKFRLFDPIGGEHCNIFMAGLVTAHRIVAVSHGYAWECQTQEGGWGLDGVIREHNWKLRGVVNGIDDTEWNPEIDVHLKTDGYVNYSIDTLSTGKLACKAALQRELGLPVRADVPLIGFIGRLDYQKGVDIIAEAMPWMMDQDLQLVMLGTGRTDLENMLRTFEGNHRDKVRGWVGFSVKTAHRITAGVDILLMPSRFEPCGLNQLYAMRYGTVPVVHSVGGLRDTVHPFDPFSDTGLGWTFEHAEASGLIHALGNAMWTFRDFKPSWLGIQKRGMSQDLSWDNAAQQYEEVLLAAKYQW